MDVAGLVQQLNPDLLHRKRLMIMTILYVSGPKIESHLFEALGLSWGDLDSNLRRLREKAYIGSRKIFRLRGPRTVVFITAKGVEEYGRLVENLRRILALASEDAEEGARIEGTSKGHGDVSRGRVPGP